MRIRLAVVGGTDVMPDVDMPSGESFVRRILYGKRYFRQALGVDVIVGWQLDTFGAAEANLLEEPTHTLDVPDRILRFDLRPFEIKTLRLDLRPSYFSRFA